MKPIILGAGNWATKPGKLLAHSNTDLGKYIPVPFRSVVRATTATYIGRTGIIQTAGINEARIEFLDEPEGYLLTEPQSTNLYLNSQSIVTQDITTIADNYTVSFYGTGTITFTGTFSGSLVGTGANDLVQLTFTATAGTLTSTISGTVDEAQAENLPYATSRIRTLAATVTRTQDLISDCGNIQTINSEEGVLYCNIAALADDLSLRRLSLSDGTNTNRVFLQFQNISNRIAISIVVGGVSSSDMNFNGATITDFNEIAIKWKLNDFSLYVNGIEVATDNSGVVYPINTLTKLAFEQGDGGIAMYAKTKAYVVYPSIAEAQIDLPYIT